MNYGRVIQGESYLIHNAVKLPETDEDLNKIKTEDLRLIDSHNLRTVDDLYKHMKTSKIILSCDVDIEGMQKSLIEKDTEIAYFRSVVLLSKTDYDELKIFLKEDPKIKIVSTEGLSSHDKFVKEMIEFGGFDKKTIDEILKDNVASNTSKKTN
jgi:hypothetical protein